MTSAIDPSKPNEGTALTADVRANFQIAHDEITALQDAVPPPFNGPNVLGFMLGVTCDGSLGYGPGTADGHAFRSIPFGQNCVITAVYACNPSVPLSGVGFTVTSNTGESIASGTINLPNAPNVTNGIGGSMQQFASTDSANMADQYTLMITTPKGPAGSTCDVYIVGFPMQPVQ